jgi:hypothetical protein
MKITHRNPAANWWHVPESAQVDPAYAAEVQRCTDHGEREYRLREGRLARAEARLRQAQAVPKPRKKRLAQLAALVELRRAELDEYRKAMVSAPASAQHRGSKSFRPVPPVTGVPL